MRYGVLGTLFVCDDTARPISLGGRKEQTLLAVLLASGGTVVSADRLGAALWGDDPPPTARRTLAAYVSRLRRTIETDTGTTLGALRTVPTGWLLDLPDDAVDARRFAHRSALAAKALVQENVVEALAHGRAALAEWRGVAFAEFLDIEVCASEAARLEALRRAVEEDTVDAELALGPSATRPDLLARLSAAAEDEPLRERRWAQLMLALYRAGSQADALQTYLRAREALLDSTGVEPGPELRSLHEAILEQRPALALPSWHPGMTTAAVAVACPYRGLLPYDEDDAALLTGRERLVARLLGRLADDGLLCITGASGSGKTSVLRAGLLAGVRAGALPGSESWSITTVVGGSAVHQVLDQVLLSPPDLLVVDQLEETLAEADLDTRRRLADRLASVASVGVRVVCCLRSDYWADLAAEPALAEALGAGTVVVGALSDEALRRVVTVGASMAGLRADEDLVEEVIARAAEQAGSLPLVSTVLARTWAYRTAGRLTLAGYRAAGSIEGAIAALAEEAYQSLDEDGRAAAPTVLTRLAAPGRDRSVVRRRASHDELLPVGSADARKTVLDTFVGARLLVTNDDGVTVAHEALFGHWPRLAEWLADDAAGRAVRQTLHPAAVGWDERGRSESDLMRGPRLVEIADWAQRRPDFLLPVEHEFVAASLRSVDAAARRERVVRRRLGALLAATTILLVAAVIAGLVAVRAANRAAQDRTLAIANRVGAQALLTPRQDLALLLAAQAMHIRDDPDTRSDLLAALLRAPRALHITDLGHRLEGVAVAPDGSRLAVSDNEGTVRLVDAQTLRVARVLQQPHGAPAYALAYHNGGRELSYAVQHVSQPFAAIVVCNARTGRPDARLRATDVGVLGVSPDERSVTDAAGSANYFWHRAGDSWTREALGPNRHPTNFTADGREFAVVGPSGTELRAGESGRLLRRLPHVRASTWAVLAPTGRLLATADPTGTISLWNVDSDSLRARLVGHTEFVESLAFDSTGSRLLSSSDDGTAILWNTTTGQRIEQVRASQQALTDAEFGPRGTTFYTTAQDGTLAQWDATGRRGFGATVPIPSGVTSAAVGAGGSYLAAGTSSGRAFVLDPATGAGSAATAVAGAPSDNDERTAPGSDLVAVGTSGRGAVLVDAVHSSVVRRLARAADVGGVAWSPDGTHVAVAESAAGRVVVVNAATGAVSATYDRLRCLPQTLAWAETGDLLAVACPNSRVLIVSTPKRQPGRLVRRLQVGADPVIPGIAFVRGEELAVGDRDGTVSFWNAADGRRVAGPVPGTPGIADALSVDPARHLVAVSGYDGSVSLIDGTSYSDVGPALPGPGFTGVTAVVDTTHRVVDAFYRDGRLTHWDVDPADWLRRACQVPGGPMTAADWRTTLPDLAYQPVCRQPGR